MKIKLLVMDVDGTLTDGKIHYSINGELFKSFNVKDGLGIKKLKLLGIKTAIITGRKSNILELRAKELAIDDIYQGIENKIKVLFKLTKKYKLDIKSVAYIGDDINDMECINISGLSACPKDAISEIKNSADYISNFNGGDGAVRDFIEYIIKYNN